MTWRTQCCAFCSQEFSICDSCWRQQRYCSKFCSYQGRLKSLRKAGKVYSKTKKGRISHNKRQRRYRLRKIETHHSSKVKLYDARTISKPISFCNSCIYQLDYFEVGWWNYRLAISLWEERNAKIQRKTKILIYSYRDKRSIRSTARNLCAHRKIACYRHDSNQDAIITINLTLNNVDKTFVGDAVYALQEWLINETKVLYVKEDSHRRQAKLKKRVFPQKRIIPMYYLSILPIRLLRRTF